MKIPWSFGGLVVLAIVYVGSYATLLETESFYPSLLKSGKPWVWQTPHFRAYDSIAQKIYKPLLWIDVRIRPTYWAHEMELPTTHADTEPKATGLVEIGFQGSMGESKRRKTVR